MGANVVEISFLLNKIQNINFSVSQALALLF